MKSYSVKCESDRQEFMDVLQETSDTLVIRVRRIKNGYIKTTEDIISRNLFELCLNTGYISEVKQKSVSVA